MRSLRKLLGIGLITVIPSLFASKAKAQQTNDSRNSVSVLAGQFLYSDGPFPYASVRGARQLSRFFEAELGLGYSPLSTILYSFGETIRTYEVHTPFMTADAALHATLPIKRFSPYVGVSAGLLRRGASRAFSGLALNGSSLGLPVGARLMITKNLGLRGEFRYRSDRRNGFSHRADDAEQSLGLVYRF